MNDTTAKILEQLAAKLGTTSEYLWGILLKQAPISATLSMLSFALVLVFGVVLLYAHKKLSKEIVSESGGYKSYETLYGKFEEAAVIPMVLFAAVWVIVLFNCIFNIGDIINGYFNPEYWALKEIVHSLK